MDENNDALAALRIIVDSGLLKNKALSRAAGGDPDDAHAHMLLNEFAQSALAAAEKSGVAMSADVAQKCFSDWQWRKIKNPRP